MVTIEKILILHLHLFMWGLLKFWKLLCNSEATFNIQNVDPGNGVAYIKKMSTQTLTEINHSTLSQPSSFSVATQ